MRHICAQFLCLLSWLLLPPGAAASPDTCTIAYSLNSTIQLTDTAMGKGDKVVSGLQGLMVLEFETGDSGHPVDGKVGMLHFSVYQSFVLDSVVTVKVDVHTFAPSCGGQTDPSWRRTTDPGFPRSCRYAGNLDPVAVGELDRSAKTIVWDRCKADDTYWSKDRSAFTYDRKNKGKGCLRDLRNVGNVVCGGTGCRLGRMSRGDNPQDFIWDQPMINGPPGANHSVSIASDLSTIGTPTSRTDGYQSYNLPNTEPSRAWISWRAKRLAASPHTTCPEP